MPTTRDPVFDRVIVDHLVRGGTRVSWALRPSFADPEPHAYQLQAGATADRAADDWVDVGPPVANAFYALDAARRDWGAGANVHYRVVLTTPRGIYGSRPAAADGLLAHRDWIMARELVRKEALRAIGFVATPGWLLKRRRGGAGQTTARAGDPRTMVLDPLTGDVIKRRHDPETLGTGFLGGYYQAMPYRVDFRPSGTDEDVEDNQAGNVDYEATAQQGRCLLVPAVARRDVFVAAGSDLRYEFAKIATVAAVRGVPLIGDAELRLLPLADILYDVAVGTLAFVAPDGRVEPLSDTPWFSGPWA